MADRLRFGVLSTARIGMERFIPAARVSKLGEVAAIASRDLVRAQAAAQEKGIPRAHGSYEALLSDPDIEAVYIGVPNALHKEWTIRSAQAGKHVLCEKPIARRLADAEEMAAACQSAGVIFMEAFMYRHHPQHDRVRELLAKRLIGEPRLIRASFCFYLRQAEGNIRSSSALEGGALMDVGCYAVNICRYLFEAEPVQVTALGRIDSQFGVDTTFAGILRFPRDRIGVIDSSFDVNSGGRYEVAGQYGSIVVDRAFTPGDGNVTIQVNAAGSQRSEEVKGTNQYALEVDHFVRSVRQGRLLPPAENGVANTGVIEALYRSAEEGRTVALG